MDEKQSNSPFATATAPSALDIGKFHGTVITYNELTTDMPTRKDAIDAVNYKLMDASLNRTNPFAFMPTCITEMNLPQLERRGKWEYSLILNGILRDGRRAVVVLDGIVPYFEVQLPPPTKGFYRLPNGDSVSQMQFQDMVVKELADATERLNDDEDLFPRETTEYRIRAMEEKSANDLPMETNPDSKNWHVDLTPTTVSVISGKPFVGHQLEQSNFIRLTFRTLRPRKIAIKWLRKLGYSTTADDLTNYHRVACRNALMTLSTWSTICNYKLLDAKAMLNIRCDTTVRVHVNNYRPYGTVSCGTGQPSQVTIELQPDMRQDKTVICCWDIETYAPAGGFPEKELPNDCITCIGMTLHHVNEADPFLRVVLCDLPADPCSNALTVVCGNEANIIRAFAIVVRAIRPELITGFNDSGYDWPWLVLRSKRYNLLITLCDALTTVTPIADFNKAAYKYDALSAYRRYKKPNVKLEASNTYAGHSLFCNGTLPIDTRTVYRKIYPKSKSTKLTYFCEISKIGSKADMDYSRMFAIDRKMRAIADHPNTYWRNDGSMKAFQFADDVMAEGCESPQSCIVQTDENTGEWYDATLVGSLYDEYRATLRDMRDVNAYCYRDAELCQQLLVIRNVVVDSREIANTSFCSIYDAFYIANGAKVRNITIAYGQRSPFNLHFSNVMGHGGGGSKYLGAYVFPPEKGLKTSKLSVDERIHRARVLASDNVSVQVNEKPDVAKRLDLAMRNVSSMPRRDQEWLDVTAEQRADMLKIVAQFGSQHTVKSLAAVELELGRSLQPCFREFLMELNGRPITGLDFSSLYPSIIRTLNLSPEMFVKTEAYADELREAGYELKTVEFVHDAVPHRSWFVWHGNCTRIDEPGFMFGVYPYILDMLFHQRKKIKRTLKTWADEREQMEAKGAAYLCEHAIRYVDVKFQCGYLNAKQLAIKVFMNTFYGEAGTKNSPFFVLDVVCAITGFGQESLKRAQREVERLGCKVYYGDTDSIYLSIPEAHFDELDRKFYSCGISKVAYWHALVELTWEHIVPINKIVNDMFRERTQTAFMDLSYEEVVFPSFWISKKKYFAVAHKKIINFFPPKLFSRGLDINKRGASEISRITFEELMRELVSYDLLASPMELVRSKIRDIYERKWDMALFKKNYNYNPKKKSTHVLRFVARMKERQITVQPNERFDVVVVTKPTQTSWCGNKITIGVGDRFEFLHTVRDQGMTIDMDYYVAKEITAQFGRIIETDSRFAEPTVSSDPHVRQIAENRSYADAKKYIDDYRQQHGRGFNNFMSVDKRLFKIADNFLATAYKSSNNANLYNMMKNGSKSKVANDTTVYVDAMYKKVRLHIEHDELAYGKWYVDATLAVTTGDERQKLLTHMQRDFYGEEKYGHVSRLKSAERHETQLRGMLNRKVMARSAQRLAMREVYQNDIAKLVASLKHILPCMTDEIMDIVHNPVLLDPKLLDMTINAESQECITRYAKALQTCVIQDGRCAILSQGLEELQDELAEALRNPIRCYSVVAYLRKLRKCSLTTLSTEAHARVLEAGRLSMIDIMTSMKM